MKGIISIILVFLLLLAPQANAFWGAAAINAPVISRILKSSKTLPDDEIIRLSKLSDEVKGTIKVGKVLDRLLLSNNEIEETFLRIAIHQHIVTRKEAEGMFFRLSDTPGFRSTLSKIIGNNAAGTAGHLNELNIADTASMYGFIVLGIGEKFKDGKKMAPTDIDIVLQKGEKYFAIEAKDYASTTKIPMDMYRADLDTLVVYKRKHSNTVIPIFTITNMPNDPRYIKLLKHEAKKRNVQLVIGSPQGAIEQIKMLGIIL